MSAGLSMLGQCDECCVCPTSTVEWDSPSSSIVVFNIRYVFVASGYRLRFKIPKTNTGKNYRATWIERLIPSGGTSITSVEVYSLGVYRPVVAISGGGGTGAAGIAVLSSTGTVLSIRITNPGSGYTSAPTVSISTATGGGTTSSGWTATVTNGLVTAITGGSAGDYLPTLAFSGGGGSGATATCTVDERGGIDSVTVTAAGSGYTTQPLLTITAKVASGIITAADLLIHMGTETELCSVWDGIEPPGYDASDPTTYPAFPSSGYTATPSPSGGSISIVNQRGICNGSACS